jgi:hypothetical protein
MNNLFINPLMLAGMAAIAVPIIIHLLNRRKFERVVWAAMRFLKISVEQNQRRIRIEDMLLLILRCALLALLAIALARPVVRSAAAAFMGGSAQTTAVIVLDNSYSMSQTDGVNSRFAAGKKAARDVLDTLPAGSSAAVLLASDIVHQVIPEPTYDLTLAASSIREAPLFDRGTDLYHGLKAALETLKGRPAARKEIYLITDGQAGGFRQLDAIRGLLEENRGQIRPHIILVGSPEERNLGITSVRVDGGLAPVNQPVRVDIRVKNHGRVEAVNVNLYIAVNDDPPMDQTTIASIPPGEEKGISLFARLKSDGHHTITARIDPDRLPADDVRTVALRGVNDVKVLLVDGDTGREARDSEVHYLRHALRPVPRVEWDNYFIKLTVKTPTELDGIRFEDFDAVIAANVTDFSANVATQLVNYIRSGGAIWFFVGDKLNRGFYNDVLHRQLGLLPAAIGDARGDDRDREKHFSLSDKSHEHDILALWKDPAAGVLSSARFFRTYDLLISNSRRPGERDPANGQVRVIARFADERPAMIEKDFGQGRVLLFASTADTDWNDLPVRPGLFVPLLHRTLGYLVARQDEHLTIPTGGSFAHVAPLELINKDAMITKRARGWSDTAKDLNEVSESRRIELVDGSPLLSFNKVNFAGAYEVRSGDAVLVRFAAQPDPEESSLEMITPEQERMLGEHAHIVRWSQDASLTETLQQARTGSELWLPLALLALCLATGETLLAHWFSKSK